MALTSEEKYEIQDQLYAKTSKPYRNRIAGAKEIVGEFFSKVKRPYLACSWGKDSIVMLHLVQQIRPEILVIFNKCLEFPETLQARDRYLACFPKTNYKEIRAEISYSDIESLEEKDMYKTVWDASNKLCDFLYDDMDTDGRLMGLRKEESIKRRMLLCKRGAIYWDNFRKMWAGNPLANWKAEDVFAYAWENGIRLSERYYRDEKFGKRGEMRTSWTVGSECLTAGRMVELKYDNLGLYNEIRKSVKDIENYT